MAGCIQKRNHTLRRLDVVRADMLSDAAGFAACHAGATNGVEQRRLAMVDVPHHRHHRRTRQRHRGSCLGAFGKQGIRVVELGGNRLVTHFLDNDHRRFLIDALIDRDHRAQLHHGLDDFRGLHRHFSCEVGHGDRLRHRDFADDRLRRGSLLGFVVLLAVLVTLLAALRLLPTCPAGDVAAAKFKGAPTRGLFLKCSRGGLPRGFVLLGARLRDGLVQRALFRLHGGLGFGDGSDSFRSFCRGSRFLGCLRRYLGRGLLGVFFFFRLASFRLFLLLLRVFLLLRHQHRRLARLFLARRDFGRGNHRLRRRRFLGCRRGIGAVTLDENALLAHLDLDRARTSGAVGGLDFGGRFAGEGDLFLRFQAAVLLAQIVQQTSLVLLGELVALLLAGNARGGELLQQRARGHFHFGRELLYRRQSHRVSPAVLARSCLKLPEVPKPPTPRAPHLQTSARAPS